MSFRYAILHNGTRDPVFETRLDNSLRDSPEPVKLRAAVQEAIKVLAVLADADLKGVTLDDLILTGMDFRRADMRGADAFRSVCINANFDGANLTRADFTDADMTGCELDRAVLVSADFVRASLRNATIVDANARGTDLTDADLTGVDERDQFEDDAGRD